MIRRNRSNRRGLTPLNLAFLDIMSCGLGAVVLIFLLIKHNVDTNTNDDNSITKETTSLAEMNKVLNNEVNDLTKSVIKNIKEIAELNINLDISSKKEKDLKLINKNIESNTKNLKNKIRDDEKSLVRSDIISLEGSGENIYLTGMKVEGKFIVLILDSSSSMSEEKLINIIKRKISSNQVKAEGTKWIQAVRALKWLLARLPNDSKFQFLSFNEMTSNHNNGNVWKNSKDRKAISEAFISLSSLFPDKGTNLLSSFKRMNEMSPKPSNIYLITDGLPTIGKKNYIPDKNKNIVTYSERLKIFKDSQVFFKKNFPNTVLNVILLPMEGDINATKLYWNLTNSTGGLLISPSKDWP